MTSLVPLRLTFALLAALAALTFTASAHADSTARLVVAIEPDTTRAEQADVRAEAGARLVSRPLPGAQVVSVPAHRADEALAELRADERVRDVVPDARAYAVGAAAPNDPLWGDQWALHNQLGGTLGADVRALDAWTLSTGDGATVAVVDSGAAADHPDLAGQVVSGYDWVDGDQDPSDQNGHGTHVTGIIAATRDNSVGVAGLAPAAKVLSLRALDAEGKGWMSHIAGAFDYAARRGVRVVSASLAGTENGGVEWVISNYPDTLFVVAAGNDGTRAEDGPVHPCVLPAPNLLCVGASTSQDAPASFSNWSETSVDLHAPGQGISSTYRHPDGQLGYRVVSGTSMATPMVSATAALLLARNPTLTTGQLKAALLDSADHLAALSGTSVTGGRLNAYRALASVPATDLDGDGLPDGGGLPAAQGSSDPSPTEPPTIEPEPHTARPTEPLFPVINEADRFPAKLGLARANVFSGGRLNLLAPITNRANGDTVQVELHAAGRKHHFSAKVADGRLRFDRRIPRAQARLGTGILTLTYPGNDRVRPQEVRLRAANGKAGLKVERPFLRDGKLHASGTISKRARGVVRVELGYVDAAGALQLLNTNARIRDGKWSVSAPASADALAGGYANIAFTGYLPARMRGEMQGYAVHAQR